MENQQFWGTLLYTLFCGRFFFFALHIMGRVGAPGFFCHAVINRQNILNCADL